MTNITKILNEALRAELPTLPEIYNDMFPDSEGDMLLSRHDPSQAAERRFSDGSRFVSLQVSYHTRCKDGYTARDILQSIVQALDEKRIEASGHILDCEAVTLPQFVSVDDKNHTYYTATIRVEYTEERTTT